MWLDLSLCSMLCGLTACRGCCNRLHVLWLAQLKLRNKRPDAGGCQGGTAGGRGGKGGGGGGTPVAAAPRLVVLGSLGGGMVVGGQGAASNSSCVAKDLMLWGWGRRSHQQLLCSKTADA